MQKHLSRMVKYGWLPAIAIVGALISDMPEAVKHADRNIYDLLKNAGMASPPQHVANFIWTHPAPALLTIVAIFVIGALLSWIAERVWQGHKRGMATQNAPLTTQALPPSDPAPASPADQKALIIAEMKDRQRDIDALNNYLNRIKTVTSSFKGDHDRWMSNQDFHIKQGLWKSPKHIEAHGSRPNLKYYKVYDQPDLLDATPVFSPHPERPNDSQYLVANNHPYIAARIENMDRIDRWLKAVEHEIGEAMGDVERLEARLLEV